MSIIIIIIIIWCTSHFKKYVMASTLNIFKDMSGKLVIFLALFCLWSSFGKEAFQ